MDPTHDLALDADGLRAFLASAFPAALETGIQIARVDLAGVDLVLDTHARHLRPGGTVMGPVLMMLADTATFLCLLSRVGPEAMAVTSSLEIHFLQRPPPGRLTATAELLKLGRRTAVATVRLCADTVAEPVAFATVTYARP